MWAKVSDADHSILINAFHLNLCSHWQQRNVKRTEWNFSQLDEEFEEINELDKCFFEPVRNKVEIRKFRFTRIIIYKSNWFLFSTRFKGGFFQHSVLVTLRSPLRPDQSSTHHSYGALRVGWTSTRQCLFFDNSSVFWSMFQNLTKN